MPSINLGESDFELLAEAAMNAQDRGDMETAKALDKIARKLNAALTNERYRGARGFVSGTKALSWKDVPSIIVMARR